MTYKFEYKPTVSNYVQLALYNIYGSVAGMCNMIFTIAMLLLTIKYFPTTSLWMKSILLFGTLVFPVFQPIGIYYKAKSQVALLPEQMELEIDDTGIHITVEDDFSYLPWSKIKKIAKKPTMIVLFSDTLHGYIVTNKMLKQCRSPF